MAHPPNVGPWQTTHYLDFSKEVAKFRKQVEEKIEQVFQFSVEELARELQTPINAGGRTPIDTGALIRSLQVSINQETRLQSRGDTPVDYTSVNPGTISMLKPSDTAHVGFTVHYAPYNEFGTVNGTPARFYLRGAAQNWPRIVQRAVKRVASGER